MRYVVALNMPFGYYSGMASGTVLSVHKTLLVARKFLQKQDDPDCCEIFAVDDYGVSIGDIINIGNLSPIS